MKLRIEEFIKEGNEDGTLRKDDNGLIEIPSTVDVRWIKRK
jgi:hypothetical protein